MASSDQAPGPAQHTIDPSAAGWALVTGATGGIGAEFARHLARQGTNLVLTGRDTVKLGDLAHELGGRVRIALEPVDLTDRQARVDLHRRLGEEGIHVSTLVNNAGYAIIEPLVESDPDQVNDLLEVNVVALTHLTRLFLPAMLEAGQGSIINVASTASYQPIPRMAVYAASKSYVRSFSNAIWHETQGTGVRVVCINPGPTDTGFFKRAGNENVLRRRREPRDVVATTFAALKANRPTVIDGTANKVTAWANRLVPERVSTVLARVVTRG
ncbi:SDR family NAD(P)-dependent oxidoreductase [Aestuariimicrobium sp. Y1814]|uniref:SDR family NAD(P)-dependent oxidoreductase n=1 Tax=Aestuariimicrobium sp. Y1814 TaxID=3418742 RepID=UPI003DA72A6D